MAATPAQLAEKLLREREGAPVSRASTGDAPPPLPPRSMQAAPPYTDADARRSQLVSEIGRSPDPASSSLHSLVPSESAREGQDGRRTLLVVFIHGFCGNETSFQEFPAHLHSYLSFCLKETHAVHTKVYPKFKTRSALENAASDFSDWLEPIETPYQDVILLGHSMGGILSAEVILQPPSSPATGKPFRHRILGTINFDTPFLGMHPGVVISGIGSLFRPAPELPGAQRQPVTGANNPPNSQASISSPSFAPSVAPSVVESDFSSQLSPAQSIISPITTSSSNDPFFNPPFPNDVRLPERKGWSNVLHFINKHSDGLTSATTQYFMSHLEFGGCLADYAGLKNRYEKIRGLEDVDELARRNDPGYRAPTRRIRFVNYYTASTGRPKAPKSPKIPEGHIMDQDGNIKPMEVEMQDLTLEPRAERAASHSSAPTSNISVEDSTEAAIAPQQLNEGIAASTVEAQIRNLGENSGVQDDIQEEAPEMEMRHIDSIPMEDDEQPTFTTATGTTGMGHEELTPITSTKATVIDDESLSELQTSLPEPKLPPIPAMPTEPEPLDLSVYTDKEDRKIAEKMQKRVMKVYQQALKARESAINDRQKLVEKREKKARQVREKLLKAEEKQRQKEERETEKQRLKEEKEEEKRLATINPEPRERRASVSSSAKDSKPKRDKKFCMLPPEYGGKRDECWVRVYMDGVDEVGAHCGLFLPGPQYESLVGDVGARIETWLQEDAAKRAVLDAERG